MLKKNFLTIADSGFDVNILFTYLISKCVSKKKKITKLMQYHNILIDTTKAKINDE